MVCDFSLVDRMIPRSFWWSLLLETMIAMPWFVGSPPPTTGQILHLAAVCYPLSLSWNATHFRFINNENNKMKKLNSLLTLPGKLLFHVDP